ncbi:TPA: hypothetical protein HA238_03425 [Candidatus Micrarchaeota archaeon]|nr:hypothetical protein [Candidatus Micrarchaeota archaeon]
MANNINDAWKSTCKIILGSEIGDLKDYEQFLKRYIEPVRKNKSLISSKDVYYGAPYCQNAKFVSMDEIEQMKVEPLGADEIKDIDSLINAASERIQYAGNKLGGKIQDVAGSENCSDAFFVIDSLDVYTSEYIAYCQMQKNDKYMFGCCWCTDNNFCINSSEMEYANRQFESTLSMNTSDAYYSYNCNGCQEVMFCFNRRSTRYAIGNNQLEKGKYLALKEKLLNEIVDELKKKKTVPSLIEVATGKVR